MSPMIRQPPGIEYALLGFLRSGPEHGYHLHTQIENQDGFGLIWHLKQSQLYAILSKLEKDGLLISSIQNQDPHPPRRIFTLTRNGHKVFEKWLNTPVDSLRLIRQEFMAKLYFAEEFSPGKRLELINAQIVVCEKIIGDVKNWHVDPGTFKWMVQQHRIGQLTSTIDWLTKLLEIQ